MKNIVPAVNESNWIKTSPAVISSSFIWMSTMLIQRVMKNMRGITELLIQNLKKGLASVAIKGNEGPSNM